MYIASSTRQKATWKGRKCSLESPTMYLCPNKTFFLPFSVKVVVARALRLNIFFHDRKRERRVDAGFKLARACSAGSLLNILEILTESPKSGDEKIYAGWLSRYTNPVSLFDFSFPRIWNRDRFKDEPYASSFPSSDCTT